MSVRTVEILCLESCPHTQPTVDRVREVSAACGVAVDLRVVHVESGEHAHLLRFLGSPSVRVDGRDVEQQAEERTDHGLQCRVYPTDVGLQGLPPASWIRAALLGGSSRARPA
jgi:hypothetical protein